MGRFLFLQTLHLSMVSVFVSSLASGKWGQLARECPAKVVRPIVVKRLPIVRRQSSANGTFGRENSASEGRQQQQQWQLDETLESRVLHNDALYKS